MTNARINTHHVINSGQAHDNWHYLSRDSRQPMIWECHTAVAEQARLWRPSHLSRFVEGLRYTRDSLIWDEANFLLQRRCYAQRSVENYNIQIIY